MKNLSNEELIEALRSIDHMNVDDCFLQSHFYSKAAARIEQLVATNEQLEKELHTSRMASVIMDNTVAEAESKLAKAVAVLTSLANMKTAGDSKAAVAMAWHAREVLAEMEKTK